MTTDYRIEITVIPDNGEDGIFFRNGERWLRTGTKENRLLDLAPHLEPLHKLDKHEIEALRLSKGVK